MAEMSSADIDRYLRGMNFPANKREIMDNARMQNAPEDVMSALEKLPDQRFNSSMDVSKNMMSGMSRSGMGSGKESSRREYR